MGCCSCVLDWLLGSPTGRYFGFTTLALVQVFGGAVVWHYMHQWYDTDFDDEWLASLWISWSLFIDPGTQTGLTLMEHPNCMLPFAAALSLMGWIYNMTLLGMILDSVRFRLDKWSVERSREFHSNHTILLGWNDKTLQFLVQMVYRAPSNARRQVVVIVADLPKADMSQAIQFHFDQHPVPTRLSQRLEIICRTGSPCDPNALHRANVGAAQDIILLAHDANDTAIAKDLVAMGALIEGVSGQVHADIRCMDADFALHTLVPGITTIHSRRLSLRLLVSLATEFVLGIMLCKIDENLAVVQVPDDLDGMSILDLTGHFLGSICMGLKRDDCVAILAPPDDFEVRAGDMLMLLAPERSGNAVGERSWAGTTATRQPLTARHSIEDLIELRAICGAVPNLATGANSGRRVMIILGWPDSPGFFFELLDKHLPAGTRVHVLSAVPIAERQLLLGAYAPAKRFELEHHHGSRLSCKDLASLPLFRADCILVVAERRDCGDTTAAAISSDSDCLLCTATVIGIIELHGTGEQTKRCQNGAKVRTAQTHIVCEVLYAESERNFTNNVNLKSKCLLCRSSSFEAGMVAWSVNEPTSFQFYRQLLHDGLTLLVISDLVGVHVEGLQQQKWTWGELCCLARDHTRGVVIGWHDSEKRATMRATNMNADDVFPGSLGSCLIVLCTSHTTEEQVASPGFASFFKRGTTVSTPIRRASTEWQSVGSSGSEGTSADESGEEGGSCCRCCRRRRGNRCCQRHRR